MISNDSKNGRSSCSPEFSAWPLCHKSKRIALAEKGVEFETEEEDVFNSRSRLLLKMNPIHKKVPVLIHKERPICESLIIVEYIDKVWNHDAPLLPSDHYQRAHARFWANYIDQKIFPIGSKLWTSTSDEAKKAAKELVESFKTLEKELREKPSFGGDTFSFVDLDLIAFSSLFHSFEALGNFRMEAECPRLVAWANRCMERECLSVFI
ncbi:Glutathione S-transferase TAU 20, putative [Theobroma cacao]|uniref:glutathione transferase n=1 Tax=Theobroma cacao TaxID=3641 RepID=A0A061F8S1_THECC|nr:Glutathione S-transferase TAU 20, putative [Theobroma cacao]